MNAYIISDTKLRVPRRAEGPGGVIGDGMVEIGPDDPQYAAWKRVAIPLPAASRQEDQRHDG